MWVNICQFIKYNWWVKNAKTKTLHRDLLFLLALKNESDEIQQNMEEKEPKQITSEDETADDDIHTFTTEHTNKYEGPITRSRTMRVENTFLLKANILMSNHFNDD